MNDDQAGRPGDRDWRAALRDAAAEERDLRAMARDRTARATAGDQDDGFAARYLAAVDRDSAAGDRADACADRAAARRACLVARHSATGAQNGLASTPAFSGRAEEPVGPVASASDGAGSGRALPAGTDLLAVLDARHMLLEARGMVMAARGVSADDAAMLLLLATRPDPATLLALAVGLVDDGHGDESDGSALRSVTA